MNTNKFFDAVVRVLDSWTALKLAVEFNAGGTNTMRIARNLPAEIIAIFDNNKSSLTCEDLADFLNEVMYNRFNMECEDGSLDEVAYMLNVLSRCFVSGDEYMFQKVLDSVPKVCTWLTNMPGPEARPYKNNAAAPQPGTATQADVCTTTRGSLARVEEALRMQMSTDPNIASCSHAPADPPADPPAMLAEAGVMMDVDTNELEQDGSEWQVCKRRKKN